MAKKAKKEKNKDSYFKGVKSELKKVSWPKFREVLKYSAATIVLCLVMTGWFSLLNLALSYIKGVLV